MADFGKTHETLPLAEKFKNLLGIFGLDWGKSPRSLLVYSEDEMELRRFDAMWVVETPIRTAAAANEEEIAKAKEDALLRLSDYIYGRNHLNKKMELVMPIFEDARPNSKLVSIFHRTPKQAPMMSVSLPMTLDPGQLPEPLELDVHLRRLPPRVVAALSFAGTGEDESQMLDPALRLMNWMHSLHVIADRLQIAHYERPTGMNLVHKNELHILVKSVH